MRVYNLQVEIGEIEVSQYYYSFEYKILVDGKLKLKGEINDDYGNGLTPKQWKERLQKGGALEQVLERY
jgi:hypothetical protein